MGIGQENELIIKSDEPSQFVLSLATTHEIDQLIKSLTDFRDLFPKGNERDNTH